MKQKKKKKKIGKKQSKKLESRKFQSVTDCGRAQEQKLHEHATEEEQ